MSAGESNGLISDGYIGSLIECHICLFFIISSLSGRRSLSMSLGNVAQMIRKAVGKTEIEMW